MRNALSLLGTVICIASLAGAPGCGGSNSAKDTDGGSCDAKRYPCGPYGLAAGSTIANLSLPGKHDQNGSGNVLDDALTTLALADYFARPALRALVIVIGTETCVPCQNEQPTLLQANARYAQQGTVAFLEAIVEGQGGQQADTAVLDAWVSRYQVPFDMTADPAGALRPYYNTRAFPSSLVIKVSDMSIVSVMAGPVDNLAAILDPLVQ